MQSVEWFRKPPVPKRGHEVLSAALKCAVGLAVGGLFFVRGHRGLAGVAAAVALVVFFASLSGKGRAAIAKLFAFVGEWLGRIVGSVLLSAAFLLVLTPVRLMRRLAGADDLRLRPRKERSYWLACDPEEHKRRYAGAMFATEARTEAGGRRGVVVLVALALLVVGSEIGLRLYGYGKPLGYESDPRVGYYPAPNQRTAWRGADIETNRHGMRAPERDVAKAAGVFRVLSLGTDGGLHVAQEALYARVLEQALGEKLGGRAPGPIEVWNVDVAGWGPASARGYVETFGTFEADAVVITLMPGALAQPLQTVLYTPYVPAHRPVRLALEEKLIDLLWQYRVERITSDSAYRATMRTLGVAECARLAMGLRERGLETLFVVVPGRGESAAEERAQLALLQQAAAIAGARYHELSPSFAPDGLDSEGALTSAGHRALSGAMAQELLGESPKLRAWLGTVGR